MADRSFHLSWAYLNTDSFVSFIHLVLRLSVAWSVFGRAEVFHLDDHRPNQRWNHPILLCCWSSGQYSLGRLRVSGEKCPFDDCRRAVHKRENSPLSANFESEDSFSRRDGSVFNEYPSQERKC